MTIQCIHCKMTRRGQPGMHGGRSKVVETRTIICRTRKHDKRFVARTVQRIRECIKCRYRWRTREVTVPIKRRRPT